MGQGQARGQTTLPLQTAAGPEFEQTAADPVNRPEPARYSEAGPVPEVGDRLALGRPAVLGLEPVAAAVGQPALARPLVVAFGALLEGPLASVQTAAAVGREAELGTEAGSAPTLGLLAAIAVEPAPEAAPRVGLLTEPVEAETEALESLPTTP